MGESLELQSKKERMVASVAIVLGAIIMAFIFGEVSMSINNFSAAQNLFRKKMTDLYESMDALGLPQNLQERIHLFYKYVWDEHHSIDGRPAILTFVPELSTNLAKEIYLYLFSDMITKVSERSQRALMKTSNTAMNLAKLLQTATSTTKLTHSNLSTRFIRFALASLTMHLASLGAGSNVQQPPRGRGTALGAGRADPHIHAQGLRHCQGRVWLRNVLHPERQVRRDN
jgi:hypothetical protein